MTRIITLQECHRCHDGLVWVDEEGTVVAWDSLEADMAFRCHHDGRMRRTRRAWEKWTTDSRIKPGGDASQFEGRRP